MIIDQSRPVKSGIISTGISVTARAIRFQPQPARSAAPPAASGPTIGQGTAFAVRPDGTLLTAFHVVKDATSITVKCPGEPSLPAVLAGSAQRTDAAVLRITRPTPHYLSLESTRSLRVGDAIFTVGFPAPMILGTAAKFTEGSVSALSGLSDEATLMQISVPVQPGNSGGPVLTSNGYVVGVVTSTVAFDSFLRGTGTLPQNVSWAVKTDYVRPLIEPTMPTPMSRDRAEAIEAAMKATCLVEATR